MLYRLQKDEDIYVLLHRWDKANFLDLNYMGKQHSSIDNIYIVINVIGQKMFAS